MHALQKLFTLASVAAVMVMTSVAIHASTSDPMVNFFYQGFGSLKDEAATAREEGKLGVFVMFDDPDCPWCAKMKATVLNQSEVQEYFRKYFRPIHLDTKGDTQLIDFAGKEWLEKDFAFKVHRVRATPVFIFFDTNGKIMLRYTGATRSVDEFLWLGEFVSSGAYKNKTFTAYKRERTQGKN